MIESYFKIVQKNLQDGVVKVVMHFLVNAVKGTICQCLLKWIENLQRDLVSSLYKDEYFDVLLYEDPTVSAKRRICEDHIKALKEAKKIVQAAELADIASGHPLLS